jgi:hypothetical protein
MGLARLDGALQGLGVHVAEHQHLAGAGRGRDAGDEAVRVEPGGQLPAFLDLLDRLALREFNRHGNEDS